ncbi:hypothetical protein ABBQ32_000172 [Trebouxia sp. C0010 RCD-2024]
MVFAFSQTSQILSLSVWHKSLPNFRDAQCCNMTRLRPVKSTQRRLHSTDAMLCLAASIESKAPKLDASPEVLRLWRSAQAVCFDVDSTLCEDESIDELADFLGVGQEVAEMTANAMGGSVKFEDALQMRLAVMNSSHQNIQDFLAAHPPRISKGIADLVQELQKRQTAVYLVSGGFRAIINPIAEILKIPLENVYANTILYDEKGEYVGFDAAEFTSRSGGKPAAIKAIKAEHNYSPLVMVGDGATDLEARQPGGADLFIGYGGAVHRENVAAGADWYIYEIQQLLDTL